MKRISLCAAALIAASASALAQTTGVDREGLSKEMNSMTSSDWRPGVPFGDKLAALPGKSGFEILRDNWTKGASVDARKQMFKGFVFNDHPDTLKVLNLGATDPDVELQKWSFEYLKQIAFIDFNEEYSRYPAWFAKYGTRKLADVRQENFDRFISEVAASTGADRELNFSKIPHLVDRRHPMHSTAALSLVKDIFAAPSPTQDAVRAADVLLNAVQHTDEFLKETVLPALNSPLNEIRSAAIRALAAGKAEWIDDALAAQVKDLFDAPNSMHAHGFMVGSAIGERDDPKFIPLLIGAIAADNTYHSVYGLGYFGLSKLTGVSYDKSHDGKWWLNWWSENKSRYSESVRNTPIPTFSRRPSK